MIEQPSSERYRHFPFELDHHCPLDDNRLLPTETCAYCSELITSFEPRAFVESPDYSYYHLDCLPRFYAFARLRCPYCKKSAEELGLGV
ncbi:hypothetical protein HY374_00550 [Candidatus Berkelbacteria bacterium]|nr:hypothetical protein [Candidatus Berkelbacteria bacterium]